MNLKVHMGMLLLFSDDTCNMPIVPLNMSFNATTSFLFIDLFQKLFFQQL